MRKRSDRKYSFTEDEVKNLKYKYEVEKLSREKICEYLGIDIIKLNYVFKKYNIIRKSFDKNAIYKTYDFLYEEYIIKEKTLSQIAIDNNVSDDTIAHYCRKYGFEIRNPNWYQDSCKYLTKDIIYEDYIVNKMSISQIAIKYNATRKGISKIIEDNNIPHKSNSEVQFDIIGKERPKELYDKEWLYKEYIENKRTRKDIAIQLNTDANAILCALKEFNIRIKSNSEVKIGVATGENHPMWKGISDYKVLIRQYIYDYLKPKVFERDNYACIICGEKNNLHHHHILSFSKILNYIENQNEDNFDFNDSLDRYKFFELLKNNKIINDIDNIVTVCSECHWNKVHGVSNKEQRKYIKNIDEYLEGRINE